MTQGRRSAVKLTLPPADAACLGVWIKGGASRALQRRAQIVLLRADGVSLSTITRAVQMNRRLVYKWLLRYQEYGLHGLRDTRGRGIAQPPGKAVPRWRAFNH
jgi:DNA invertase Pin-like site-specific DNA recombinase